MTWRCWRLLMWAQVREQPVRLAVTAGAIALGVALGTSVYLVNASALEEFGLAAKRLAGEADLIVRGPREGFPEALYPALAHRPGIAAASPMVELDVALAGRRETLKVLGLDPFRAAALEPLLYGEIAGGIVDLFATDGIYLSSSAARQLDARRGAVLPVLVGNSIRNLRVLGLLSDSVDAQSFGIMDIASAQWTFDMIGRLNRIDLRLAPGSAAEAYRTTLERDLPAGVRAIAPQIERDRVVTVTRAYRVNLNMLGLVALWTGAFLVFATQSLSVMRRRSSLALLRAVGVTRGEMQVALVAEGALLGAFGALCGVCLGVLLAAALLRVLAGDLGNGQLHAMAFTLYAPPLPLLFFFAVGTLVAGAGAWAPARSAARQPPALALKGGDPDHRAAATTSWRIGAVLLLAGAALAQLPAVRGLPIFGYMSVGSLLFGAVLLVPTLTVRLLKLAPSSNRAVFAVAIAQLRENVGLSTLSLASIIVSFSLMVAMAIMVFSFRVSFEHWLGKLLPADLQMREPFGNDTAYWSPSEQARLTAVPGIERVEFRRTRQLLLDAARPPVTLIARGASRERTAAELPLVQRAAPVTADTLPPAWISESLQDLYSLKPGDPLTLPLGGRNRQFRVAGVWRDYARTFGAVAVAEPDYIEVTGDRSATEASIWLDGRIPAATVETTLRAQLEGSGAADITTSTVVRERSLQIFDRAFAITYALEAVAVIIGLAGVSFAASSTALARRAEFGMLRHIGMLRRQVVGILAGEGLLMSLFGVLYGLTLGAVLSLVLVYVVNRQSFNWSIDLAIPIWQLATLSATLIAAAALTAIWSGRAATSQEAVRAVREDW